MSRRLPRLAAVAAGALLLIGVSVLLLRGADEAPPPAAKAQPATSHLLYYRNPMGAPDISPVPKKDEMGMDYLPVYGKAEPGRRLLRYYRNPMGAPDISPVPKQDEMGMDYLPVYVEQAEPAAAGSGEASSATSGGGAGTIDIDIGADKVQKLGVQTAAASMRPLQRSIVTVGRLAVDERRVQVIAPRFEGWVDNLQVNALGQRVQKGQVLFTAFMHELFDAELAYRNAVRASLEPGLTPAQFKERELQVLTRLRQLERSGATAEELTRLRAGGDPSASQLLRSPVQGVVLEKMAVQGARFMPGEVLYRIADLSQLLLLVEVPVAELGEVAPGTTIRAQFEGWPQQDVSGRIDFIYPQVQGETRTVQARVPLPNPGQRWPVGLMAQVQILLPGGRQLMVPESALIDAGGRQVVLVARGEGRYQARGVRAGRRAEGFVVIEHGLQAGEQVVTAANFLLDAESNVQAALRGLGGSRDGF